ncbi:sulfite reductase subunit alpha [Tsukamurella sp. 8F]|uniref:diflavin oxidoreductase n=1 Tax=unclassified Tsukamurella TaxID=2633480 RepID=UPI0023BA3C38|nr:MULTISPECIES: sulfite reductase subunit alpha [unclassified Tsukamurella]MDF0530612.1 sulfite reductase subunit alpha [Tsukamurella sp. 8J]MDF0587813.1 sulfite reductase subunit alpha [Tsukamurella sp. 8F]
MPTSSTDSTPDRPAPPRWSKRSPYQARVLVNRRLSLAGSSKEIHHFELDLGDSGIEYQPGDALAVLPVNPPALVQALLDALELDPDTDVDGVPLRERLLRDWEIATPHRSLMKALAERDPDSELAHVTDRGDKDALHHFLWGRDVLDLLHASPTVRFTPVELAKVFRPLQPRAYSISSSPLRHPGRAHLTVAAVRYTGHGGNRVHGGVCSTFLADRAGVAPARYGEAAGVTETIGVFPQPNKSFRLPGDDAAAIMIGPGTGLAPFRGFLHERAERGARGGNWLFFGDQHRAFDYLYADEIAQFEADGVLTELDLAFSRDQTEKIYVQDRMFARAAELWAWLQDGAHVYVCGDGQRMARDVDAALHHIVAKQGGLDADAAATYIKDLKKAKRYVRDVW